MPEETKEAEGATADEHAPARAEDHADDEHAVDDVEMELAPESEEPAVRPPPPPLPPGALRAAPPRPASRTEPAPPRPTSSTEPAPPFTPATQRASEAPSSVDSHADASSEPEASATNDVEAEAEARRTSVDDEVVVPALHATGASQLPPAPVETIEAVAAAVGRLRQEVDATTDRLRKARLLSEAAEIQERGGDEQGAARDYLAAYNADTSFREPLEALLRLLERRRSVANLGQLIEALVVAATTPEERARAFTERAVFFDDVQNDLEGARAAAREAIESGAGAGDLGAAWLTLEIVAAKLGDRAQREEALAGRAALTGDPTWRGHLLVDLARLAASSGDVERAVEILARARDEGGAAAWRASVTAEAILRGDPGLPGSGEASTRATVLADWLEARASLIERAVRDPEVAEQSGVPRHERRLAEAVAARLAAAESRRLARDNGRAAEGLDRALASLADARDVVGEGAVAEETRRALEGVVANARLRLAETMGDTALAAELAGRKLDAEADDGLSASLAMRIAEHAASEGDVARALEALRAATARDPLSAPARALELDILQAAGDEPRFAQELEDVARRFKDAGARGRMLVFAAWVWATRAGDAGRARSALDEAQLQGVDARTVSRLARSLASLRGDDAWYEIATASLVETLERDLARAPEDAEREAPGRARTSSELATLLVEIVRLRMAKGDGEGAEAAIVALREHEDGAWLGRILEAFSPQGGERAAKALAEVASLSPDAGSRRSLTLVNALRAQSVGDLDGVLRVLRGLFEEDASDPVIAAFLADLLRLRGDHAGAARVARETAEATSDPAFRAARRLEAGFDAWDAGDRDGALAIFEAAQADAPEAANAAAMWAARGLSVDGLDGRRKAVALAPSDDATTLERFALESTLGDAEAAEAALAELEVSSDRSLRLAAMLARLAWPAGAADADATRGALDVLEGSSEAGVRAAAAERLRLARDAGGDPMSALDAAEGWVAAGGGMPAAVEWLAATVTLPEAADEIAARRAVAELLEGDERDAFRASATLLDARLRPSGIHAPLEGTSHAVRLANLELAAPGSDPRRRADALLAVGGALGHDAQIDAQGLAGWSRLVAGQTAEALEAFRAVTASRPEDLHAWEGMRTAAEALGDREAYAVACEQLGARSASDERGAAFWEQAALTWLELARSVPAFEERAEGALDASFARDAARSVAFDRLFRRVRERKDSDKLLAVVGRRLEVSEDAAEIAKMYWEMARVLREKGDPDGALEALEHVTTFDENHVGALALTGEIFIRRGMYAEAAEKLGRLARVEEAPPKNRMTAGIAAVDLYENKLSEHGQALAILRVLHQAKLTTLPMRERLARAAGRTGSWEDATSILEELMVDRPEPAGRIEAARLAVAIHRDRRHAPADATSALRKLLEESPGDPEALDLLLRDGAYGGIRKELLERGRQHLLTALNDAPSDVAKHVLLSRVARGLGDTALEQATLSCVLTLEGPSGATEQTLALLSSRKPRLPQGSLGEGMRNLVLASGDEGPVADLFAALGPTLAEALGPSLATLGVHARKDRVDPKAGLTLRSEIAAWASAFGIPSFDLYIGGKDPAGIQGIPGETPALVVGSAVNAPLSPTTRARIARELLAIVRGTTVTRSRDDATIEAIVIAACNLTKVRIDHPPASVLAEVERLVGKAISRKTKAAIEPICQALVQSRRDAKQWAARARVSQSRVAAVASGDVAVVLADVFGEPVARLHTVARDDLRAHELLRFVLSRPYFEVRRALGLEG